MIEHLTQNQVEDFCTHQLRPAELLSVTDHLGECEACRRRTESAMNGDAVFFAMRSEVFGEAAEISSSHLVRSHPTVEQTAGYVDGNLASEELQMVSDHLTGCEHCALAVDDLRSFRDEMAPSLGREYRPAAVLSPAEGWWQRTVASLRGFFRGSPGLAFGALTAVLLLALMGWLILRSQSQVERRDEIADAPTPSPAPAPVPAPEQATVPLVAQLKDGEGELTLDREGKLSGAENLPPSYQIMLKDALSNPRIEMSPHLKELTRPPSSLMSPDNKGNQFSVIEPVGKMLMTDRPTFRWSPLEGATGYVVEVYDKDFNVVITSPELTTRSWAPPRSLSRGSVYAWQVKAIKEGQEFTSPRPPAAQAKFRIVDRGKASGLAKAKRAYPSSHLTLGLLYAEAGLLKEAEEEFRLLQSANPDSEIPRSLLRQVQSVRR